MNLSESQVRQIFSEELEKQLTPVNKTLDRLEETVTGGGDSAKGLVGRVTVLETRDESRSFWTRSAITLAAGALVTELVSWMSRKG